MKYLGKFLSIIKHRKRFSTCGAQTAAKWICPDASHLTPTQGYGEGNSRPLVGCHSLVCWGIAPAGRQPQEILNFREKEKHKAQSTDEYQMKGFLFSKDLGKKVKAMGDP
ncbi:hypothetical protein PoB_006402800 [Plakobranchus ocellatus]|uniref:Uncharacterized protein n=1 Tax=Plakobranchus ocellatus TaxID=259542 RepID=A0AAV4D0F5_9GAST|nr:hypothetical protein PoB_006402800 [Plakobranchus ocellatus]